MLAYVLTVGRVVLAAAFAACAAAAHWQSGGQALSAGYMAALLVLAAAAEATDLLDGPAARRGNTVSRLGGLLDPLCDSLGRLTMYFAAALAGWVWLAVPLAMVGRDLIVAYVRIIRAHADQPTSARGSGKVKAIIQGGAILVVVALAGWSGPRIETARAAVAVVVILVTVWSLIDYLRGGWPAVVALYRSQRKG